AERGMTYFGQRAPYGALLKGPRPEKLKPVNKPGKQPRELAPAHLAAIRKCPCMACRTDASNMEAAHIRMSDRSRGKPLTGLAMKPDDKWTLPLCHKHHMEQHNGNEELFWINLGIDPLALAE